MAHDLSLILTLPIAGALALVAMPARRDDLVRWVAATVGVVALAASVPLWLRYDAQSAEFQFIERLPWIPPIGAEYFLGVDGFSIVLILLTTLVGAATMLGAWRQAIPRVKEFNACLLLLESAMLGAFMALDLLLFYVCSTLAVALSYVLIRNWSTDRRAARRFAVIGAGGSLAQLIAILAISFHHHSATGVITFDMTRFHQLDMPMATQSWIFLVMFFGYGIVPMIMAVLSASEAPVAAAALVAALGVKIGSYGLLRVALPIVPDAARFFAPYVMTLVTLGAIAAALNALVQKERTRVASLSASVAAVALYGMFGLAEEGIAGSMVQQISHGVSAGALFLLIGVMDERRRAGAIVDRAMLKVAPLFTVAILVTLLSLAGAPPLSGFVGDRLIMQSLFPADRLAALLAAGGLILSAAAALALCRRLLFGTAAKTAGLTFHDLGFRELAAVAPLLALSIWIGVSPASLQSRLKVAAHHVASHVDPSTGDAAECDTVPTPEQLTATPGSQFLLAVPCGPNGEPLGEPPSPAPPN